MGFFEVLRMVRLALRIMLGLTRQLDAVETAVHDAPDIDFSRDPDDVVPRRNADIRDLLRLVPDDPNDPIEPVKSTLDIVRAGREEFEANS